MSRILYHLDLEENERKVILLSSYSTIEFVIIYRNCSFFTCTFSETLCISLLIEIFILREKEKLQNIKQYKIRLLKF